MSFDLSLLGNLVNNSGFMRSFLEQLAQSDPSFVVGLPPELLALLSPETLAALQLWQQQQQNTTAATDESLLAQAANALSDAWAAFPADWVQFFKDHGVPDWEALKSGMLRAAATAESALGQVTNPAYASRVAQLREQARLLADRIEAELGEGGTAMISIQEYINSLILAITRNCNDTANYSQTAMDHLPQDISFGDCNALQLWLLTGGEGKLQTAQSYYEQANQAIGNAASICADLGAHRVNTSQLISDIDTASYTVNALMYALEATQQKLSYCFPNGY